MNATQRKIIDDLMKLKPLAQDREVLPPLLPSQIDIPQQYWKASQEGRATDALQSIDTITQTSARCLILSGPTGCGKTYAACVALMASPLRSKRFVFYPDVCGKLIGFSSRDETTQMMQSIRLLVIDDFGAGAYPLTSTSWSDSTCAGLFDAILTAREAHNLPTIITTNHAPSVLRSCLSDRLLSRLEGQWGEIRVVGGPDLRKSPLRVVAPVEFKRAS